MGLWYLGSSLGPPNLKHPQSSAKLRENIHTQRPVRTSYGTQSHWSALDLPPTQHELLLFGRHWCKAASVLNSEPVWIRVLLFLAAHHFNHCYYKPLTVFHSNKRCDRANASQAARSKASTPGRCTCGQSLARAARATKGQLFETRVWSSADNLPRSVIVYT